MPSYPGTEWNSDVDAWQYLKGLGFTEHRFIIRPPSEDYVFDHRATEAVNYLVGEWDWGYEGH